MLLGRLGMAREFTEGLWSQRRSMAAQDGAIRAAASSHGLSVNPHRVAVLRRKIWLAENERMYGRRICPSFEPTGDHVLDAAIACPCSYLDADIAGEGVCRCALLGKPDATSQDFRRAEKRQAERYQRATLNWSGRILDTRDRTLDARRGLPVPSVMHQVRLAIARHGLPLSAIVDLPIHAEHLAKLAAMRGFSCKYDARAEGGMLVRLGEA